MKGTARSYLSDDTKKRVKGMKVLFKEDKEKYTKTQFIRIYKGYDFLENLFTVRHYIQRHYKIDLAMLEILLKLMALKVFSRKDYSDIPKLFTHHRFNRTLKSGYIIVISDHYNNVEKRLFTLSTRGKNIVINFYQYLSGEKRIPETRRLNPMAKKSPEFAFDKKKIGYIKRINQIPVREHTKTLFS